MKIKNCKICGSIKNIEQCLDCLEMYCSDCMKWAHSKSRLFAIDSTVCETFQAKNTIVARFSRLRIPT